MILFLCFCGTLTQLIKDKITGSSNGTYKVFVNTTENEIEVENKAEELKQEDDLDRKKNEEPVSMHQVNISNKGMIIWISEVSCWVGDLSYWIGEANFWIGHKYSYLQPFEFSSINYIC